MNEILMFIEIFIMFGLLLLSKKLFGKTGMYIWIAMAAILANIQINKCITVFGISGTIGNVMFSSIYLATDILSECYNKESAQKGVNIGLFAIITYIICMQISLLFMPNSQDTVQGSMKTLFSMATRVSLSSIIMFYLSNLVDVKLYNYIKLKDKKNRIWLRNNISTILCNCAENFGFVFLAFIGIYNIKTVLEIAISTSIIEIIIAILDTPYLYLAKKIEENKE